MHKIRSANTVSQKHRINKTVDDIQNIANKMQDKISIQNARSMGITNITGTAYTMGIFPGDWTYNGSRAIGPYGYKVTVATDSSAESFDIRFYLANNAPNIPTDDCINIIMKLSTISDKTNDPSSLRQLSVYQNGGGIKFGSKANFPLDFSEATTICGTDINHMDFYYDYTRVN